MKIGHTVHSDPVQDTNVVQLREYTSPGNPFRSREPRKDGPFVLAGRIKNRDQVLNVDILPD